MLQPVVINYLKKTNRLLKMNTKTNVGSFVYETSECSCPCSKTFNFDCTLDEFHAQLRHYADDYDLDYEVYLRLHQQYSTSIPGQYMTVEELLESCKSEESWLYNFADEIGEAIKKDPSLANEELFGNEGKCKWLTLD